jgi:4-coumarate--CoA ligase
MTCYFFRAYVVPHNSKLLNASSSVHEDFSRAIQNWVKSRVVHYKALRGGVVLTAAIPRSTAGKILRKDLRALAHAPVEAML